MFHKIAGLATAGALVIGAVVPAFATFGGGFTRPSTDRNINRLTVDNYAESVANTGNNQIVVSNETTPQPTFKFGFGGGSWGGFGGDCGCIGDITLNTGDATARATANVDADLVNDGEVAQPMGMQNLWFGGWSRGSTYNLNEANILNQSVSSANTGYNTISVQTGSGGSSFRMPGMEAPSRDVRLVTGDADSQASATVKATLTGF